MGPHRGPLAVQGGPHVDVVSDKGSVHPDGSLVEFGLELGPILLGGGIEAGLGGHPHQLLHRGTEVIAVQCGLVHESDAGQLGRSHPHPVDHHVVGVPVDAVGVITGDQVSLLLRQDRGQRRGGLLDVGLPEAVGILVGGVAPHARVPVAEHHEPVHTEQVGRRRKLGLSDGR